MSLMALPVACVLPALGQDAKPQAECDGSRRGRGHGRGMGQQAMAKGGGKGARRNTCKCGNCENCKRNGVGQGPANAAPPAR